eukprot:scaffold248974_cov17-Tisochrysis_lutea.AAC.1
MREQGGASPPGWGRLRCCCSCCALAAAAAAWACAGCQTSAACCWRPHHYPQLRQKHMLGPGERSGYRVGSLCWAGHG